jgi:DNA modification methylase
MNSAICCDGIHFLKECDDNEFDIIFTSPPFKNEDVTGDYWSFYDDIVNESIRVANKVAIIIHTSTKMNDFITKYQPKRTLIWGKGIVKYAYRYNPIYVFQPTDNYKVNKYIYSDTFGITPIAGKKKVHKYEDPLALYYELIKMFKGCTSIHDPFCGSGTTLVAAHHLGLQYSGTDINDEYVSLTNNRLLNIEPLNF